VTIAEASAPADLGLDPARLSYLDEHLRRYVDSGKMAGTLVLVARGGEIGHVAAHGLADRERNVPMARDTIFRIYSMTKPITSVALMQLYERGLFQIDDPVEKYIPEWKDQRVYVMGRQGAMVTKPVTRPMTVRDLLSHQSGLTYGFLERTNADAMYRRNGIGNIDSRGTLRDMVTALAALPLEFSPGDAWNYSVATDVCGYLVEVISGQQFDDYLQANVFDPLGMSDTGFHVPHAKAGRLAANYGVAPGGGIRLIDDPATSPYLQPPSFLSGGGGLVSTIDDYLRFCQALLNGGELDGRRIIGRKTLEFDDLEPPARGEGPCRSCHGTVGGKRLRRDWFRAGLLRDARPREVADIGHAGRVLLGWRREHRVLDRPDRRPDLHLHDAADALIALQHPAGAAGDRVLGAG